MQHVTKHKFKHIFTDFIRKIEDTKMCALEGRWCAFSHRSALLSEKMSGNTEAVQTFKSTRRNFQVVCLHCKVCLS